MNTTSAIRKAILSAADAANAPAAQLLQLQREAGQRELNGLQNASRALMQGVAGFHQAAAALLDLEPRAEASPAGAKAPKE